MTLDDRYAMLSNKLEALEALETSQDVEMRSWLVELVADVDVYLDKGE